LYSNALNFSIHFKIQKIKNEGEKLKC